MIVKAAVFEDSQHVGIEEFDAVVVLCLVPLSHTFQVHGVLDVVIIVRHFLGIDGEKEGPSRGMTFDLQERKRHINDKKKMMHQITLIFQE